MRKFAALLSLMLLLLLSATTAMAAPGDTIVDFDFGGMGARPVRPFMLKSVA